MRFRRASVRYSTTPTPATPYQAAQQLWDERLGSARVQALNWRRMAFGCLILAGFIAGGLLAQMGRSSITPYVVEVDRQGAVRAVGPATDTYQPSEAQLGYHLEQFIRRVRSRSIDPIVLRDNWLAAYESVTDRGAATLNDYARTNDPFARVGQTSVAVEVTSVVRASENSFQVRWIERAYANGALATTERWTAILTVMLNPPRDEQRLRQNPLGIYVDGLNWSRELNATG